MKHLYILLDPALSLDLPSVHHPHWREGVGDMKALPTQSPWDGKKVPVWGQNQAIAKGEEEGRGVCECDFFPSGGEPEELGQVLWGQRHVVAGAQMMREAGPAWRISEPWG